MNISSLSQQLNISVKELRQRASEAGFNISPRARKIDNILANKIITSLQPQTVIKKEAAAAALAKKIKVGEVISVRDFAGILGLPATVVIKSLIDNGVMASLNEQIDFDTASIVGGEFGFEVEIEKSTTSNLGTVAEILAKEKEEDRVTRAPIAAVMGHVDHGKTKLLDTIRKANVMATESGAITQHIGAYQVEYKSKPITFLDTPGHESFAAMRARGANVTDIIVLVVAADDGVKPQTLEVINRAKLTKTPLIVAINKIDLPDANQELVKKQLADAGVLPEEWGGKTVFVPISAKQNIGVDKLLEMILLLAEVEDFKANPSGTTAGTVIESHLSKTQGPVASVIIQNGTLKISDFVAAGAAFGKVRNMIDEHGKSKKIATPSTPVRITGLSSLPEVGDILLTFSSVPEAQNKAKLAMLTQRAKRMAYKTGISADSENQQLNLLIKADTNGSLEAIEQELQKLENKDVVIKIISKGIGDINDTDILDAESGKATILGFHNKISPQAQALAKQKKVNVDIYQIIYELTEDVTSAILDLILPEVEQIIIGEAKILAVFATEKSSMIIGGVVKKGKIDLNKKFVVLRAGEEIGTGKISELQHNKIDAKEVIEGKEFGMRVSTKVKIAKSDILRVIEEKIKEKKLRSSAK